MNFILDLTIQSIIKVGYTLLHNWPYLLVSIIIATLLKLYLDETKVAGFLRRYRGAGVVAATTAAVATPLCSCGTTAVVLGMMASMMPWAPIVAFMVSSPLTSPEELIYSAGLFGWPFALAFFLASIMLGLAGGLIASILENRGWLANQTRFSNRRASSALIQIEEPSVSTCSCGQLALAYSTPMDQCICDSQPKTILAGGGQAEPLSRPRLDSGKKREVTMRGFTKELYESGVRLLLMFVGFAFVGYFLNGLIPPSWVAAIFGEGNAYSVPLAATLGLPLYINTEASLPLIRTLLDAGMSQGSALAFMIAGSGTSIGAIAGALTIARWRIVALVVGILWAGAIISGYLFDLGLIMHLF